MATATILLVEDDNSLREALKATLDMAGYCTVEAQNGRDALVKLERQRPDIVVSDVSMEPVDGETLLAEVRKKDQTLPFVLMTAFGSVHRAVRALKNGATDYLQKPFDPEQLLDVVGRYIQSTLRDGREPIVEDPKSIKLFEMARRVADSDATVLLSGPSGAGKEVLARFIHRQSRRKDGPFVAINCAAIPENMLEAVLFGYEKGAFTGAHQSRPGKFELANYGTLLLDEISEMPLALQAKLLRVLQEREVERLGGRRLISLDVRIVATTNRNLREEVWAGRFREDLYYRLNVFPLQALALRERPLDIVPIAEAFIANICQKQGRAIPKLSNEAKSRLLRHTWPGNVRELENVMQRALILAQADVITIADIHIETETQDVTETVTAPGSPTTNKVLVNQVREAEFQVILSALERHQGNRAAVAEELGISPRTLRYKLAKMREQGIEVPK
ncbi:MAG: sigma-54-dependent Fis family transcriptional regulator [Gammaproteobacteria bacterium]|nr:MAG: sigma-54-dependent Fis family transcriptional regulator [Gammaproteobacteria bacterium]